MVTFSNDADILKYEPILFGELHLASQVLLSGVAGSLSGTTFTASGADFTAASVTAGCVIYLQSADGLLDGCYEIISVDSASELTVSVLRADCDADAIAPPAATDISYRITTYRPQTSEVGFGLTEYFGIKPGNPTSPYDVEDVLDTKVLKHASVFAVICSLYTMLAGESEDNGLWQKSLRYQRLFEKARRQCRLSIDSDGDGISEETRLGGCADLIRD